MTNTDSKDTPNAEWLKNELRQGSEVKHFKNRLTPDGKEMVEMIPLDWALEIISAKYISRKEVEEAIGENIDTETAMDYNHYNQIYGSNATKDKLRQILNLKPLKDSL